MIVNVSKAKAQLSKLIDRVYQGEKVVIANLVPHTPEGKRILGFLKNRAEVPDEALFGEDAEVEGMFYGKDDCES